LHPDRWRQIDDLFQAALQRPADERGAFLAAACAGDDALEREVRSLLLADERGGTLLETPLAEVAADVIGDGIDRPPALADGAPVGPYRVLGRLGAGGMGEVYRAHDPRIGREVAIKVLPAAYALDTGRLRRFEQEARAAGALDHPNVLAVHDVGRHEGVPYLVAELLAGETLRARLDRGPLAWRKAVELAAAIADGLAAAHAKDIVHRDLKPENVFLTRDGRVKLLDFGIAKLREAAAPPDQGSQARTRPGEMLGTVGYMSPEQVTGRAVDARSDLFALGSLLYEMVCGRRAFERSSPGETIAAILTAEPPELDGVPLELQRLIAHSLEKDPASRFQSAHDLGFALRGLRDAPAHARRPPRRAARLAGLATGVALLAVLASLGWRLWDRAADEPSRAAAGSIRFTLEPPENAFFVGAPIVSPDGRRLVSVVNADGRRALWLRPLAAATGELLARTEDVTANSVSWSLDGRSILFNDTRRLARIDVEGHDDATVVVSRGEGNWGTAMNGDGIVLLGRDGAGIYRVSAAGGVPSPLLPLDAAHQEIAHAWPKFLPDGRHFLYFSRSANPALHAICVGSLDGKVRKRLLTSASHAQYGSGHLLYVVDDALVAQPFDAERLALAGDPFPVAGAGRGGYGQAAFSVSSSGVLAYRSRLSAELQLVWIDRSGKRLDNVGPPVACRDFELSPDGSRVVFDRVEGANQDIWTMTLATGQLTRLTFDAEIDHFPIWSPDGRRVVFDSHRGGRGDLYEQDAGRAGAERLLLRWNERPSQSAGAAHWSWDGRFIAFHNSSPERGSDIWILPLQGDRRPFPYLQTPTAEFDPRFSPNGRWMAFAGSESGVAEVYVQAFAGASAAGGGKWQVSSGGGVQPRWRSDGKEMFYLGPRGELMAVEVETEGTFAAATPRRLFSAPAPLAGPAAAYAVAADGRRFLWRVPPTERASTPIEVVVDWPAGRVHAAPTAD
jgi:Tol biopolymer transport system component